MKRILALLFVVLMICSLCACGNKAPTETTPSTQTNQTTDPTIQISDEIPTISDVEMRLLSIFGQFSMDYPVMTWAIDMNSEDNIAYYLDIDNTKDILYIGITESASDLDPKYSDCVFSSMLIVVDPLANVESVATRIENGMKLDRWGVSKEDVAMKHAAVGNYLFVAMTKSSDADMLTRLMSFFESAMLDYEPPTGNTSGSNSPETAPVETEGTTETTTTQPTVESTEPTVDDNLAVG